MYIPTEDKVLEMTPTDFEKYSLQVLNTQCHGLKNYIIQHNKIIVTSDGKYQIDGYIEFEVMGVKYKTLIECKHYKRRIDSK